MKKGQKQGRNERTQEGYPTSSKISQQISGSLLVFFHLCLVSVLFSGPSLTELSFTETFSLLLLVCIPGKKTFCKISFQLRMDLEKGQKQGRDE